MECLPERRASCIVHCMAKMHPAGRNVRIKNSHLLRGLISEIYPSQRAFAVAVGLHNSTLSNLLAGRRGTTHATAERICQRAGVQLERVFTADEPATTVA